MIIKYLWAAWRTESGLCTAIITVSGQSFALTIYHLYLAGCPTLDPRSSFAFTSPFSLLQEGGAILPVLRNREGSVTVSDSQWSRSHCTMSVCALSPIRFPGSMSGFFQVASLLGLLLLLFKAVQLSLRRQWLLKAVQQFPSQPSHWLFGHKNEVGRNWTGQWEAKEG